MVHWGLERNPMYHYRNYYLKPKKIQLLGKYQRWRKRAEIIHLSTKARLRLEWIIFYHTIAKGNANTACEHFSIYRSNFYYWLSRFDELNLKTLEDKLSIPNNKRKWNPDPIVLVRMIKLRKKYIHWSKLKLSVVYENIYKEKISSWQFQKVITEFHLFPVRKPRPCKSNGAKKQLISFKIRHSVKNLFSIDTKVLWLFGLKYYILAAIAHTGKLAYIRAYRTHSSMSASDFLSRVEYLLKAVPKVILTDNGSEFKKYFSIACSKKHIKRYFSRVQTPKDNPEVERMIKTYIYEWLNDGKWSPNLHKFNKYITDFLITYNCVRPHQKLKYLTPMQYAVKHRLLSERSSSSTSS